MGVGVAPRAGGWDGAAVGAVVLGLARECELEKCGARTRQPLRAPTPTPSPPRRGRLHRHRGMRRLRYMRAQARPAAATFANRGHSCRWGDGGGWARRHPAGARCAGTPPAHTHAGC
ncbi:hypothetical protein GCM10018771_66840 [Streptomyces cellulosae]|nr:hypothetical protein GCM10018771_66840 [Streptomyces cellulosae]